MKSNIDLTEDRDFPDPLNLSTTSDILDIDPSIFKALSIPWRLHLATSDSELEVEDEDLFELFLTGTKSQIVSKHHIHQHYAENHCDRCGARLENFPWKNTFRLCAECEAKFNSENRLRERRIPWKNRGLLWT